MLIAFSLVGLVAFASYGSQTYYEPRDLLKLYVASDGRIEAYIAPPNGKTGLPVTIYGNAYMTEDWSYCYRNFLQINPDTGELIVAFNIAKDSLRIESHVMTSKLPSGEAAWSLPLNATEQPEDYIQDNMVLWWDESQKAMVMLYQQSSYAYYEGIVEDWLHDTELDAYDQRLFKTMTYDMGQTWTEAVQLLEGVDNPHVHYQIVPSSDVDEEGLPTHLLIPVHHLSEGVIDDNYQMIYRTERTLDPSALWTAKNLTADAGENEGFIQASIIRCPNGELVAFLRDCNGYWIRRTYSVDDGYTWTNPIELPIPNPDSMSQAVVLHSGQTLLIYNPQQSFTSEPAAGDRYSNSHHLVYALSEDFGMTWQHSIMTEYAYDGMFNYPVALQDPTCDNILVSYSVMTRMAKGCTLLEECTMESAGTQQYIKFTVINEDYIKNEFDFYLDTSDACTWQIPPQIAAQLPVDLTSEELTAASSSAETAKAVVITLACLLGIVFCGNIIWFATRWRKGSYVQFDSEAGLAASKGAEYETTKGAGSSPMR